LLLNVKVNSGEFTNNKNRVGKKVSLRRANDRKLTFPADNMDII